jgi:uncharacterized protein YegL
MEAKEMLVTNDTKTRFAHPTALPGNDAAMDDVMLCDISGSMNSASFVPGLTKRRMMHAALTEFLMEKIRSRSQDNEAIVAYATLGTQCCGFLNAGAQHAAIQAALDRMLHLPSGGTCLSAALDIATQLIHERELIRERAHSFQRIPIRTRILAFSDGYDDSRAQSLRYAEDLKRRGVLIETFGVAEKRASVDESFLKQVATNENGFIHYRFLGDGDTVRQTFKKLARLTLSDED